MCKGVAAKIAVKGLLVTAPKNMEKNMFNTISSMLHQ